MKTVKIGIIGTGVGIRTHFNGFKPLQDASVVAICGSSPERSKEFADKYGIPIACSNYDELCSLNDIDLVCATPPNRFHLAAVKSAVAHGKHVICEKPLSDNLQEVDELSGLVEGYSNIAVVDHQLRYNPYIQKIKELITSGELGEIKSVSLHQTGTGFANPNAPWSWSFDGEQGGGVRLAMASHFTDLIQYWFGERDIISVDGYLNPVTKTRKGIHGENRIVTGSTVCNALIILEDELSVSYSINAGSYVGSRFDISIFGTEGEATFSLQHKLHVYHRSNPGNRISVPVDGVFQDEAENKVSIFSGSFRYFAPVIIKAIQTGKYNLVSTSATFSDAKYNLRILDAIQKSANSGEGIGFGKESNNYV